ncbi:hypothetical protein [Roseateles violae]|uniref:Cytochrome c domain-containing protein n=1 Tax=Roseateles violae TaxID=3058042 RepID=A0ABT8DW47_9BURK|nr:hypothetical protein [Pelomonas sp. PFR6]MDN3922526.1 hypothetical protein [Pelomonas sp. PFR6]
MYVELASSNLPDGSPQRILNSTNQEVSMDQPRTQLSVKTLLAVATAVSALLAACAMQADRENRPSSGASMAALESPASPAVTVPEAAIVVRDMTGLQDEFSFGQTIGAILRSAMLQDTLANRVALVDTMRGTFNVKDRANPISGLAMVTDQRPREAALVAQALLDANGPDGLIPIGFFNRLDLAPADWSDCGEHRIVYSTKENAPSKRFLLIFEAKLPNPQPERGLQGCQAVAAQWQKIGAATTPTERLALLKALYFQGLPGHAPVVHYLNYGGFLGQVRANLFVSNNPQANPWQLREFRITPIAAATLAFVSAPVQSNPWAQFYSDNKPSSSAEEQQERVRFQEQFRATYMAALRHFDEKASPTLPPEMFNQGLLNCIGAPIAARDNEFQSVSQGNEDNPATVAGAQFRASLPATWQAPAGGRSVSRDEILNRAGVITCGGCHQFSVDKQLGTLNGTAVTFPRPKADPTGNFFFVHISEEKEPASNRQVISNTLRDVFIPHRMRVLTSVLSDKDPGALCAASNTGAANAALVDPFQTAQRRARVAALSEDVLRPQAAGLVNPSATPTESLDKVRNQARTADEVKPGAVMPFRRPH